MTNFDKKALENLETLSRIKCTPEEEPALLEGIRNILDYIEQLEEVDTEKVPACNFVLQDMQQNITRTDEIKETMPTDLFLYNTADSIGGMIKVPPILK